MTDKPGPENFEGEGMPEPLTDAEKIELLEKLALLPLLLHTDWTDEWMTRACWKLVTGVEDINETVMCACIRTGLALVRVQ